MKKLGRWTATLFALLSAVFGALLFIRIPAPGGFALLGFKLLAGAFAPLLALLGWAGAVLGALSGAPAAVLAGLFGMFAGLRCTTKALRPDPFALVDAFGGDWQDRIAPETGVRMLPTRHGPIPRSASYAPKPLLERDVIYYTLPNGRRLLCDVWSPPAGQPHSGLAIVYAHGSAWTLFDKDFGTRPFFRHLAQQGHVIVDIAYRLYPEVQIPEMLHDVQRALAFTRLNAARLGIDPARIVLGGASAGGHLSLLAAYAPQHPELVAPELSGHDLSVRAVFSYYGPCDLGACFTHTNQQRLSNGTHRAGAQSAQAAAQARRAPPRQPAEMLAERANGPHSPIHTLGWFRDELEKASAAGSLTHLLGCRPEQNPRLYALYSPLAHVHAGCPPTLLAQGEDDLITPAAATRAMTAQLKALRVPVVSRIYPHTEHGFDLLAPEVSPASLSALYDLERFLVLV